MLVHAYNGFIDHLHGGIVSRRQAIHDPIPDARLSPKMPSRTRRSSTLGTPRGLFGNIGVITDHS
jgi:hypothetical protein